MNDFIKHRNIASTIPDEVVNNYCSQDEFKCKADKFFQQLADKEKDFRLIKFPFSGSYLLDEKNWEQTVKIVPEFIVSIIDIGINNLLKINSTEITSVPQDENISINDIGISSNTIKYLWSLTNSWIESKYQDFDIQKMLYQSSDIIINAEVYSDIRGCLQLILSEIKIRSLLPDRISKYTDLYFPKDKHKRRILLDLVSDYTKICNYLDNRPGQSLIDRGLDKLKRDINNNILRVFEDIKIIGSNNLTKENIKRATTYFEDSHNILFVGEYGTGRMHLINYLLIKASARHEIYHCGASKDKNFDNLMLNLEKETSIHHPGYLSQTWNGVLIFQDLEKATDFQKDKIYQLYQEKYSNPTISKRKLQFIATITPQGFDNLDRNLKHTCFPKKIFVPSLIEIKEDIPELAHHFFIQAVSEEHLLVSDINKKTFDLLKKSEWDNNIAELKNFSEEIVDEIRFVNGEETVELIISRMMNGKRTSSEMKKYNKLKITLPKDPSDPKDKAYFQIGNNQNLIKPIELSADQASLLLFLAMERKNEEEYWLEKPDKHRSELKNIFNRLYLANYFEDEISIDPPGRQERSTLQTWIWDFDNKHRRVIVSDINKKLKNLREIDFKIIIPQPNKVASRKGNYALNKQIEYIDI